LLGLVWAGLSGVSLWRGLRGRPADGGLSARCLDTVLVIPWATVGAYPTLLNPASF
jgi:hypothetical protein